MSFEEREINSYSADEHRRDREQAKAIQKNALESSMSGVFKNKEASSFLNKFPDQAIEILKKLKTEGALPYSIIPIEEEKIYAYLKETLRIHAGAFYVENDGKITDTMFDLSSEDEENQRTFQKYIVEMLAISLENVMVQKIKEEDAMKLARYRDAKWIREVIDGTFISKVLSAEEGFDQAVVQTFLANFPSSKRMQIAADNIKNPETAFIMVASNYLQVLSDANITEHFKDKLRNDEITELLLGLQPSMRMTIAVGNIKNPTDALDKIANNYLHVFSDQGIKNILQEKFETEKITELIVYLSKNRRMRIAISNKKTPKEALGEIAENYFDIFSTKGIHNLLGSKFSTAEIAKFIDAFPNDKRMDIAIFNKKSSAEALKDIADNYFTVLSGENIHQVLEKHKFTEEEIVEFIDNFPSSRRMHIANRNIKKPEKALIKVADNYLKIFSNDKIEEQLSKNGFKDVEIRKFIANFLPNRRMRVAVFNIQSPKKALSRVAKNFLTLLSDEAIGVHFKGRLADDEIKDFLKGLTLSQRMSIAISDIVDSQGVLDMLAEGKIKLISGGSFHFSLKEKKSQDK